MNDNLLLMNRNMFPVEADGARMPNTISTSG
jgi:hypothetical protein